ncbi:MAG TPA: bifunctional DNA primase/polymerase [Caldisericia bacterium]|nr:bifunctional DNA primase/polymerase [Caldisericia bacterium]
MQEALRNNDISTTKNLSYALKYLKKGFSIIPVKGNFYSNGTNIEDRSKDSKAPLIAWTEYQNRLPTEVEVKSWWTKYPLANIAVITGKVSNLVVVDFDSDEAVRWARENNLLETLCVETARGLHAYYRYPQNRTIQNTVNLNNMKIDIRADGGYVIAPPSIHITGMEYTFTIKKPIASLPEIFLSKSKKVIDLKSFYNGVKEGSRNDTLARLCGSWVNDNLSLEECLEMAYLWNERNNPPLDAKEVERTVKSIYKRHHQKKELINNFTHEKNLLFLPIFVRNKKSTGQAKLITCSFTYKTLQKTWKVIPSIIYGLAGSFDELVFTVVMHIADKQIKPLRNPVDIGKFKDFLKLMNLSYSGENVNRVKNSLRRLHSLTLSSKAVFYNNLKKVFIEDDFHLFDRIVFKGEKICSNDKEEIADTNLIWLNQVIIDNLNSNYTKKIDFDTFLKLQSPIARGIYKIGCAKLYSKNNKKLPLRISYSKLCQYLQITQEKYKIDVQNQLKYAHNELINNNIFSKISIYDKKYSNNDYYILYIP